MARNFTELRVNTSTECQARFEERVQQALQEISLEGLREARALTQTQFAQVLQVSQGAVSNTERRTNMYIRMLRSYERAIGGDLQIRAGFSRTGSAHQPIRGFAVSYEADESGIVTSNEASPCSCSTL